MDSLKLQSDVFHGSRVWTTWMFTFILVFVNTQRGLSDVGRASSMMPSPLKPGDRVCFVPSPVVRVLEVVNVIF